MTFTSMEATGGEEKGRKGGKAERGRRGTEVEDKKRTRRGGRVRERELE